MKNAYFKRVTKILDVIYLSKRFCLGRNELPYVRLNISRNIQLINKKFDINIDGRMKKRSWKNEACGFINFEVIIKKPL